MRVVVTTLIFLMQGSVLAADLQWVRVAEGSFVLESGKTFVPWGFNYDHDANGRLIEDYWDEQWASVEEDFWEMQRLGANVVRIHLQVGKLRAS